MIESRQDAEDALVSSDHLRRYHGALYFIDNAIPETKELIEVALRRERVRHVKMALNKALININNFPRQPVKQDNTSENESISQSLRATLRKQAIDEFSGVILHELAPKIGLLESVLTKEFDSFSESQAKVVVLRLKSLFTAIESLRKATNRPEVKEFDLHRLIQSVSHEELELTPSIAEISYVGAQPCLVRTDAGLLSLAISNGVRNSLESLNSLGEHEDPSIILSWGSNDNDNWVSVLDNGIGVSSDIKENFELGSTNKQGHAGFGMSIIQQAMDSLGGIVTLENVNSGGAKLTLRWGKFFEQ
ncbi:sensor histidine kinase [Idiomarina ramblicola]|uniref:Sensor histidine kinase n=1 Tax=Idiomarina ramblicola TaxID=263724 RepID=A0A432Z165_9GAMM|nr:HAMP domain-containing sensor histidine kinase [Idiomarina ramblicola]RUO71640.1 sensor histidine kinase [Idiomarina ramblicola]